jgi:hypothetical protein
MLCFPYYEYSYMKPMRGWVVSSIDPGLALASCGAVKTANIASSSQGRCTWLWSVCAAMHGHARWCLDSSKWETNSHGHLARVSVGQLPLDQANDIVILMYANNQPRTLLQQQPLPPPPSPAPQQQKQQRQEHPQHQSQQQPWLGSSPQNY